MANPQSFNTYVTEASNIRDVAEDMLYLDENRTVLYTLTNGTKRKKSATSPRIEWFEENDLGMIGTVSNGTTAYSSVATGIFVTDITLFGVNDVVQVARAVGTNSQQGEFVLVSAVAGTTNGTITVTRGFAGSIADTIGATNTLKILGVATTENGSIDNPRTPARVNKTSGCQIFEWPIQITRTGAATKVYTAPQGDRADKQTLGMRRQKLEIENAGLWGRFSETLASPGSRWTSMGVRSIIATNVTDAGGTLTYQSFLPFSRNAFRYGASEKLLAAGPIVKEGLDFTAGNKILAQAGATMHGVQLKRYLTPNGTWNLATNYNMDTNSDLGDEAIGIDLASVEYCPLVSNGQNLDTKIFQDYDPTNPKLIKDLVFTQAGWRIRHEARHARLYDVLSYA
jgi:Family of unknown function (DUF5309)